MKTRLLLFFIVAFGYSATAQSWKELSDSLIFYYKKKDFSTALPWAEKATVATKEKFGAAHPVYSSYLTMLAGLYISTQQPAKAIPVLTESLDLYRKNSGEESKDFIQTLNLLAVTYSTIGQNHKAAPLLVQATAISRKTSGEESADYAASLNKLGKVYEEMGQYDVAEPIFIQALAIRKKISVVNPADYATSLNNLALLYKSKGAYEKAEPLLIKALSIRKEQSGENSTDYANSCNNLAALYETLGQYDKAEPLYLLAVKIYKEKAGPGSGDYATSLQNLAQLYKSKGNIGKAEELLLEVVAIQKKIIGEDHPLYITTINNLASVYLIKGDFVKAAVLYQEAIVTGKKILGEFHPDYARSLNDLAYLYRREKKYSESESLYLQALTIFKKVLGENHPDYAGVLNNLAALYQETGQFEKAEQLLTTAKAIETKNLLNTFTVLSEKEKAAYMTQQASLNHTANSFLLNYPSASPSFYTGNYDLQLLLKGLSLTDTKNVLDAVRSSKDTGLQRLFNDWQQHKSLLAKQYSLAIADRREDLVQLENETEEAEKELNTASAAFRSQAQAIRITSAAIQEKLQADEAAIEFVSFDLYDKEWTGRVIYAAYILRKNDKAPVFVYLTDENNLQQLLDSAGKTATALVNSLYRGLGAKNNATSFLGKRLYQLIWQPLEPYLEDIKKIAYSPAGKLYSIAFDALPTNDSAVLLIDKYQLKQYTSTREIAIRANDKHSQRPGSITIFGNASFSMDSLQLSKQKKSVAGDSTLLTETYNPAASSIRTGVWANLPGTADEAKKISELFKKNKIGTTVFTQKNASEENLKAISGKSPQLLHLATHGFFIPALEKKKTEPGTGRANIYTTAEDPLLRSGLILAGANYAWSGKRPVEGVEDGIVTAYEISQLDLSNTELVVLSACETALGDIKGSEGVFGLQRAFKLAGAKNMIVSLWQVPDKETVELMNMFYLNWIKGATLQDAFAQAQTAMRKKYAPFYWAAFILID